MDRKRKELTAVVDTNVIAYYLLETAEFAEEARHFWRQVTHVFAPAIWEAEMANVIWMSVRGGVLNREEAPARLGLAGQLGIQSIVNRVLWQGALARSLQSGVAVYDTLFVELAEREDIPLVTFDAKLLKTYPDIACRPKSVG